MWSTIYGYYEIRASANYHITADTRTMKAELAEMPELAPNGLVMYKNADGFPWVELALSMGNNGAFSYSADTWNEAFDMIPIVCSKSENGRVPAQQLAFFIRLAKTLNWELVADVTHRMGWNAAETLLLLAESLFPGN